MIEACPKCDAPLAGTEAECPACGVVIAKALAAARKAPPAAPPARAASQPPKPRPSVVSEETLRLLQGTGIWVHGLAAFTFLAGILILVGFTGLLLQTLAAAVEAAESLTAALALTLPFLVLAIGCTVCGLRLAGFAGALAPRRRELQDADLSSVADAHRRLWWWILVAYLGYVLSGIAAWLVFF